MTQTTKAAGPEAPPYLRDDPGRVGRGIPDAPSD